MDNKPVKIEIEVSEKCEATAYPYWLIIDPKQNFWTDYQGLYNIASMITGPFFSREEAEDWLLGHRYNYGRGAKVFCASGHNTIQYRNAFELSSSRCNNKAEESNSKS